MADEKNTLASWSFDRVTDERIEDDIGNFQDPVYGKYTLVTGVEGKALKFDGFRTYILRKGEDVPKIPGSFTIEAWIALGAYPWFWGPVVDLRNASFEGFTFGIDKEGYLGIRSGGEGKWQTYLSDEQLPLRTWIHIAAVYDGKSGLSFYVNGQPKASSVVERKIKVPEGIPLFIGRNYTQEPWEDYQLTTTGFFSSEGLPLINRGMIPKVPQYTRGLPR